MTRKKNDEKWRWKKSDWKKEKWKKNDQKKRWKKNACRLSCSLKSWLHNWNLRSYSLIKRENIEARAEVQLAAKRQAGQKNVAAVTTTPGLPSFVDGKDKLDKYLLRFEKFAIIAGWQRDMWAVQLRPMLPGKALDVCSGLSSEDARDYNKLWKALLQRNDLTKLGNRESLRNAK